MENLNIHRVPSQPLIHQSKKAKFERTTTTFAHHLDEALVQPGLKLSKHAQERLRHRKIQMTDQEWRSVAEKVNEAKLKGIDESLVLTDKAALIVSAKNSTVITAMDRKEAKSQIFTNIDGTIILS